MSRKLSRKWNAPSIATYAGGVAIFGLRGTGKGNDEPPKRGKISGWSLSSRRRMREWMLTHEPREGLISYGVTLTVPGPPPSPDEARKLWNHFTKHYITRNGCGMVWRIEVQKRGSVHWHCIAAAPAENKPVDGELMNFPGAVRHWWAQSLRVLGVVKEWDCKMGKREVTLLNVYRDQIIGADFHAVDVETGGEKGAWMRYLQDHATKAKQEQIAEGFGRHWGVVGRQSFRETVPSSEMVFTCKASYWRFWRAYHRLTQPVMSHRHRQRHEKFHNRPFDGKSLGWSSGRGLYGVSVWFSKPDTVRRLFEWAEREGAGGVGAPGQVLIGTQRPPDGHLF